jgi:transposase
MDKGTRVTQIGLDCHRTFSISVARNGDGRLMWRRRLNHADRRLLRTELGEWPRGTPVILEGTFGWSWLSNELAAAGMEPHLASSRKVAAWREARGLAKSNRTDGELLSELWSQQPRWWEVWLPPREVRDQREWLRYRMTLVQIQTGLKNRIHAVLHRHGIVHELSDLFGRSGRQFLSFLALAKVPAQANVGDEDSHMALARQAVGEGWLPESARATLHGYLQLLDQVRQQIAQATRVFRRQVTRDPVAEWLRTLPGISYILAYTILAEIGRIERFHDARHLISYSLLAPRADDSGEPEAGPPIGRHVGRAGRRTLKWAFIEAAHGAVQHGGRFRALFDQRTAGGQQNRNRGYIVVARHLCQLAYVLWKKGEGYREDAPPRPGSRRRRRWSRPGTGQPDDAMVGTVCRSSQASS